MSLPTPAAPPDLLRNDTNHFSTQKYASNRASRSGSTKTRSISCCVPRRNAMPAARVKRWEGLTRTVGDWDGLRKDSELWFEDGDCLVHLYARGQSQRGPSFCVPFKHLQENNCGSMFSLCFAQMTSPASNSHSSRPTSSISSAPVSCANVVELYIPAPEDASRERSFNWHITTRNFFAFLFDKSLVGKQMGQSLVELQERMHLFRSGRINNHQDFLDYAEGQGYRDFVDCPDYALAMLYYAEHYKLREIWIDAFSHCVGMNEILALSPEFRPISPLTKALITRSYLDMDIQLDRVMIAVSSFLEDELSPVHLGLSDGARMHLDRFRSFLRGFYVEKFGYWPPPEDASFSKALYKSMYFDFKNTYDYLVDLDSTDDLTSQKPASGGICVLQNVQTFDKRNRFAALPHPLPLLPEYVPLKKRAQSQNPLGTLTLSSKQAKMDQYVTARAALTAATNSRDTSVTSSPLVKSYMLFERQCALSQRDEKVTIADARKVRWLLIYGTLQYLISAIRAPKEVRDAEEPTYPLCCLVTEKSPWQIGTKALTAPAVQSVSVPDAINTYLSEPGSGFSSPMHGTPLAIQPDCQTNDYFTHTNQDVTPMTSRPVSVEIPAPLRILTSASSTSVRSFRRLSFSSKGSRRSGVGLKVPAQAHSDMLVYGLGTGLNDTIADASPSTVSRSGSIIVSNRSSRSLLPEGCSAETSWLRPLTPESDSGFRHSSNLRLRCNLANEHEQAAVSVDHIVTPTDQENPSSSSGSAVSLDSPFWSDNASASSKSSNAGEIYIRKDNSVENSGLLGGFVSIEGTPTSNSRNSSSSATPTTPNPCGEFHFSFHDESADLTHLSGSSESTDADADADEADIGIGFALSTPIPSPSPMPASCLSETLAIRQRSSLAPNCFSAESPVPSAQLEPLNPLKMNPLEFTDLLQTPRQEVVIDMWSALSLTPKDGEEEAPTTGRTRSKSARSILDAIPPPIAKVGRKVSRTLMDEEERGRKKDRRRSFWRR
ncbi:hypothetical protein K504DRAFT_378820 [Pleomassaria siparia CBS 279.74]|uniref:DUF8004 domain-containing protein n=1 Tax=Pleomassaria siparia CBS 279.74 TaxID=1314801 RepID=A0A6G1KAR4_9PLEO|nr:hypothetical protein K504DRAFT_378820 [Pleomassaria siparia CBS 279.74]